MLQHRRKAFRASAAWDYSIDPSLDDSNTPLSDGFLLWVPITVTQNGNATKVGIEIVSFSLNKDILFGLYTNAGSGTGAKLQDTAGTVTGNGWAEFPITSQAVTASTSYHVAWICDGAGAANQTYKSSAAFNRFYKGWNVALGMPASLPVQDGSDDVGYTAGIYVG